jgi:tetratricopeptide (TPR) repeat protein
MPSLEQLKKFKASLRNIANEAVVLSQLEVPQDELPLPGNDPAPQPPKEMPPVSASEEFPGLDGNNMEDVFGDTDDPLSGFAAEDFPADPEEPAVGETVDPGESDADDPDGEDFGGGFDFGDLLGAGLDNLSPPAPAIPDTDPVGFTGDDFDLPEFKDTPDNAADVPEIPDTGEDFNFPDFEDTGDVGGEPAAEIEDTVNAAADENFSGIADDDFDFSEFENIQNAVDEPSAEIEDTADGAAGEDFFNMAEELDIPGVPEPGGEEAVSNADENALDFPENEALSLFPEGEAPGADIGEKGFSVPDVSGEIPPEKVELDAFDGFNLGGEDANEGKEAAMSAMEDFSLAGIDDVFGAATTIPGIDVDDLSANTETPEDTVEEIRLDENEFSLLQNTIQSYPLNLRIAIEEIIAEQAVSPDLMSSLIKLLVRGGAAKEAASIAGKILGRPIPIPNGFEKKTGEALEEEQASLSYIFVHKFLPVLRFFLIIALLAASLFYLAYEFIYTPLHANSIYKQGYELIPKGSYAQANERFKRALQLHRQKNWFYKYAEAFRDERQYLYAEEKYDELLRYYPKDKKGALDYAVMETYYLRNYAKADRIIRLNVLEYAIDDKDGLLALGDNNLLWGEVDPSRYEEARGAYARLLERYGWQDPIVERMLKYFIRVDNLGEVLPLQQYFMSDPKRRKISAPTLAELGGYLMDKRFEDVRGVPDEHISQIEGIKDILIRAVQADPALPEAHYHLARYYNRFGNNLEEQETLEIAARAFDYAPEESIARTRYRLNTQRRLAELLISNREFFAAEEQLVKGIGIYEDAVSRHFLSRSPEFGRLYADLGDLEYFTKLGNMSQALDYYLQAERNGWAPPDVQYRMGAAYYQQEQWVLALDRFFEVSSVMPLNRRLLNALGNVSYMRGDYYHAQGYYNRLLEILDAERARFPMLMPNDRPEHMELAERIMTARNNLAVALEALTKITGDRSYRSRALGLYAESSRAWDSITRNPETMVRAGAGSFSTPGVNLAFLNSRNTLYPEPEYEPQIYIQIDKDIQEPSDWESLIPQTAGLSDVVVRRGRE